MLIQIYLELLATLFICRAKAIVSDDSWSTLNETVHGRVRLGSPIARPCFRLSHNVIGEYDEDLCQHIVANYTNRGQAPLHMTKRNTNSSPLEYRASVFDAYMNVRLSSSNFHGLERLTSPALDAMGDMSSNVVTLPFR